MADREKVVAVLRKTFGSRLSDLEERLSAADEEELPGAGPQLPGIEVAPGGRLPDHAVITDLDEATEGKRREIVADGVSGLQKVLDGRDDELTPTEQVGIEAIIVLEGRPPLFIKGGDFVKVPPEWAELVSHRAQIKESIARVGRVEVEGHPDYAWIGTGWLAGPDAIITNRHVAREFARADGAGWTFEAGMSARLDFNEEFGALDPLEFAVTDIVGIHESFDLAVLRVAQTGGANANLPSALTVAATKPGAVTGRRVYVIGYPAWDGRRNDPTYMRQIFGDVYDVKRLQPGEVTGWNDGDRRFIHDSSTLGGNSGSPVFDLDSHHVIGLHYGGRYLAGNNAVPLWTLTQDPLLTQAGVNFAA